MFIKNRKILSTTSIILLSGVTLFFFQNCNPNQMSFDSAQSTSKKENQASQNVSPQTIADRNGIMLCSGVTCNSTDLTANPPTTSEGTFLSGSPSNNANFSDIQLGETPTYLNSDTNNGSSQDTGTRTIASTPSLAFKNLSQLKILSHAFQLPNTNFHVSSNSIELNSLPVEGAIIKIVDANNRNEEGNSCQFAFNINDEASSYCDVKKDRIVYNGDKLKFIGAPSRFFNQELSMYYQIGNVYAGTWSIKTMDNPGTKPSLSGSFGNLTRGKSGQILYSGVITVAGLSTEVSGLGVPVTMQGLDKGFELIRNGEIIASKTTFPLYGIWIKNGDKLQLKINPSSLNSIYRARLILEKIGSKTTTSTSQNDYLDWSVQTDAANSQISNTFCAAGSLSLSSLDGSQMCDFSWQAAEKSKQADVVMSSGATLDATCSENNNLWTYKYHCPGKKSKSCHGGQIANIPSQTKTNTFCVFSWSMTAVGMSAQINDISNNGGKASGFICKDDGSYKQGDFICP